MNFDQARFNMVEQQIRPWNVLDPKILDLLMDTPRHEFVSEAQQALAYMDTELPIGEGQTMLLPRVEGRILQALDIKNNESVLEIGTGVGYLTALLAKSAKTVKTVEFYESIQKLALDNLKQYENITFEIGDGSSDWNDNETYDVIILGGATNQPPKAYQKKLNIGGRLLVTSGEVPAMTTSVLMRVSEDEWETETLFETDMPHLINAEPEDKFSL